MNFIKFNADDMEGKRPSRVYYCSACFGWHVTAKEGETYINPLTNNLVNEYHNRKNTLKETYSDDINKAINQFRSYCGAILALHRMDKLNEEKKVNVINGLGKIIKSLTVLYEHLVPEDFEQMRKLANRVEKVVKEAYF